MGYEIKIRDSRTDGDRLKQFVDVWADSSTDIPTAKESWVCGSIAFAIDTGVFYVLNSSGVWVNQDESSATNAVSPTSLSLNQGLLKSEFAEFAEEPEFAEGTEEIENETESQSLGTSESE